MCVSHVTLQAEIGFSSSKSGARQQEHAPHNEQHNIFTDLVHTTLDQGCRARKTKTIILKHNNKK